MSTDERDESSKKPRIIKTASDIKKKVTLVMITLFLPNLSSKNPLST